ncbi:MAG: hypothetical protein IJ315_04685 [Firmicutes bacterium]|nr:hypothetical protein [Bacillota bacterium]
MLKSYFQKIGSRRVIVMLVGNIIIGLGVAVFKLSGMGNDPFSAMMMALSAKIGMSYPLFQVMMNCLFFIVQLLWGRHLIGIGTIVNALGLGYFTDFFYKFLTSFVAPPNMFVIQVVLVVIGVLVCSFGLSWYQLPDVGVAPYDALALIAHDKFSKIPYFWCRIATDGLAALLAWFCGGIIGLGTLVCAFGLGPFIQFFNVHFTSKLLKKGK